MKARKLSELKESNKLKGLVPDVPSFDEYYESKGQGKHPFETDKYQFDFKEAEDDLMQREASEEKTKSTE